jgi:2-iminobutanoate/2-iminopropanoate deaminase
MAQSVEIDGLHHGGMPIPLAATVGPLLASSGVLGMDAATGELGESLEEQAALAFANVRAIMAAAGGDVVDIVKMTCFVNDRSARDAINHEWVTMFPDAGRRPARHTLVQHLPPGVHLQLEIIGLIQP